MFSFDGQHQDKFIRRIDNNLREMFDIVINSINRKSLDTKPRKELEEIDKDINKFYMLITKVMLHGVDNPMFLSDTKTEAIDLYNNWWVASNLEHIGDNLKGMLRSVDKDDVEHINTTKLPILNAIRKNYEDCIESYYKADKRIASEAMKNSSFIREEIEKLFEEKKLSIFSLIRELEDTRYSAYQIAKMTLYLRI